MADIYYVCPALVHKRYEYSNNQIKADLKHSSNWKIIRRFIIIVSRDNPKCNKQKLRDSMGVGNMNIKSSAE
jgi:hypothetical protein